MPDICRLPEIRYSTAGARYFEERVVYPQIGRKLTINDIGKNVVRVKPTADYQDWSYCYYAGFPLEHAVVKLSDIQCGRMLIGNQWISIHLLDKNFSDHNWTTEEELTNYLKILPEGVPYQKCNLSVFQRIKSWVSSTNLFCCCPMPWGQ